MSSIEGAEEAKAAAIERDGYRLESGREAGFWWISFCIPGSYISAPFQGDPTLEAIRAAIDAEMVRHRG